MNFTQKELDFIRNELGIQVLEEETNVNTLEEIWDAACEIEIEESNKLDVLSERGMMAVSLVTKLGDGTSNE